MVVGLFYLSLIIISIELLFIGLITGFYQKEFKIKDILLFFQTGIVVFIFLKLGQLLASATIKIAPQYSNWYAATILFVLGLKMFYDGIKMRKLKQYINPLEYKGLLIYGVLSGINSFFVGLTFGLLGIANQFLNRSAALFILVLVTGYIFGLKIVSQIKFKNEFIAGFLYIIMAIIIAKN